MESRDASEWRAEAGVDSVADGGDDGDFLNIDQDGTAGGANGAGDSMFMLYLEPDNGVVNGDMGDYSPIEGDMDNVNLMLDDVGDGTAPTDYVGENDVRGSSNWTQLDNLGPIFESTPVGFDVRGPVSSASTSNTRQPQQPQQQPHQDWSRGLSMSTKVEPKEEAEPQAQVNTNSGQSHAPNVVEGVTSQSPSNSTLKRRKSGKGSSGGGPASGSIVKTKSSVPTAKCRFCDKETATNGANFKRHEAACMRQKGMLPPSTAAGVAGPFSPHQRLDAAGNPEELLPSKVSDPSTEAAAMVPMATQGLQDQAGEDTNGVDLAPAGNAGGMPTSATNTTTGATASDSRTDSDLSSRIRRLEQVISTIDVSARISVRDSLISLSNKAANLNLPRTPEQEEMNRAAEYLVLRMLFLSEPQAASRRPRETSERP